MTNQNPEPRSAEEVAMALKIKSCYCNCLGSSIPSSCMLDVLRTTKALIAFGKQERIKALDEAANVLIRIPSDESMDEIYYSGANAVTRAIRALIDNKKEI